LPEEPSAWLQPAATALVFLGGQLLGFLAIQRGDVSVATPVMGVKVVLVAVFVLLLLGERAPAPLWIAAVLSSLGIAFLGRTGSGPAAGRVAPALVFGGLTAAAFALFDVLVQKWAPGWGGAGRFLPVMMGFVSLYTLVLVALLRGAVGTAPPGARRPLLLGGLLMAVQAVLLIGSLATFSKATSINIVYSARGLWSVLAVWGVGHWFGNTEHQSGPAVFRARLVGAVLLLAAIALVLTK
jgi:drug/metabolite transporter (DMT)-like permease